jgi:hypothetical protein
VILPRYETHHLRRFVSTREPGLSIFKVTGPRVVRRQTDVPRGFPRYTSLRSATREPALHVIREPVLGVNREPVLGVTQESFSS